MCNVLHATNVTSGESDDGLLGSDRIDTHLLRSFGRRRGTLTSGMLLPARCRDMPFLAFVRLGRLPVLLNMIIFYTTSMHSMV